MRPDCAQGSYACRQPSAFSLQPSAFTLVEMLITTSLMTLVAGAIIAVLSGGLRVWSRASQYGVGQQASLITFEQLRKEVQNHRHFALVPFKGAYDAFEFPSAGQLTPDPETPQEIGRLGYYLDSRQHTLCRSFAPYRLTRHLDLADRCEAVLHDVQRLRFEYFGVPEGQGDANWSGSWESAAAPSAVKVSMMVGPDPQRATTHTVLIYLGENGPSHDTE